uniref:Aldehyde dehydrogenase family 3 member F1 n=1 Tax=Bixa orellana TaxID=66672 RepID=A0A9Y0ZEP4_BIXOR|nr:aldehyde dehydrogenase family 3 member F1 [Bixa orellana]
MRQTILEFGSGRWKLPLAVAFNSHRDSSINTRNRSAYIQKTEDNFSNAKNTMEETLAELRETFKSRRTRPVAWRKKQLNAILNLIHDNEDLIFKALYKDLGKHPTEAFRDEVGVVEKSVRDSLSCLEKWVAPKKRPLPLVFFPARGEVLPEPLGVVLIFSSWNFPIILALEPVIGAVSAGNAVVLKPSELAPACSKFLKETIPLYLDKQAIRVIDGGADVGEKLLNLKWDKIFFTGSPRVGRIVLTAAAKHLTPVTLELGGKCPAILDTISNSAEMKVISQFCLENINFYTDSFIHILFVFLFCGLWCELHKVAVKRIAGGKWTPHIGQACIAIDYVLVQEHCAPTLVVIIKILTIKHT